MAIEFCRFSLAVGDLPIAPEFGMNFNPLFNAKKLPIHKKYINKVYIESNTVLIGTNIIIYWD
jgi:hypothetical protein